EACGPLGWGPTTLVSSSANLIPLDGLPPILTSTGVKGGDDSHVTFVPFRLHCGGEAVRDAALSGARKRSTQATGVCSQCKPACYGKVVRHLSLFLFGSKFLDSEEHAGFLYVRSTLQSLQGLPLPNQPYLFGLLVHRAEVPWAKAFPLRLMLRLGAEYRYGLMVQVTVETMVELRRSLREMKDYTVTCGRLDQPESRELVCLQWVEEKCTVFFLVRGHDPKRGMTNSAEQSRLTERIARAFCLALCPHLKLLKEDGMAKLGLRVTFDSHEVRTNVVL
ncbi:hypothetical protein GOODEAATRI_008761, partial [Goodea atripinnis]